MFSRDGDITELPKGATVLDFAYYVHTQIGNRAQGAKVNGRYVPLTYQPKTGDQVEIITKSNREPNRDWLVSSLGYITTSRAKSKLRQWFNKIDRDKNIETGKGLLLRELERLSLTVSQLNLPKLCQELGQRNEEELYLAISMGEIGVTQIVAKVADKVSLDTPAPTPTTIEIKTPPRPNKYKIDLEGLDNVVLSLAKCCNPVHGEPIGGFITLSQGVSIHKLSCPEFIRLHEREPDRFVRASWQEEFGRYQPVSILVEATPTNGLLKDLVNLLDKEKVNIQRAETLSADDSICRMKFFVEVAGIAHLSRLLNKIEQQPAVMNARRSA